MLAQQIFDELLPRIVRDAFGWVQQAQGRWRYHGLLYRHVRIAHGYIQVRICVAQITKRAAREPQHTARMTVREGNFESVRGRIRKPMYAVCQEIGILPLFAVRDDRRSGGFKPFDGVSNRLSVERGEGGAVARFSLSPSASFSMRAGGLGMLPMGSVGMLIRAGLA